MLTGRRALFTAIAFATLAAVCWQRRAERNDERAYFARDGHIYRVEMKGRRFPLVHDPVSFLVSRTYEATLTMELPRIEGVIEGTEIPVASGKLPYVGRVVITKQKMKVDLYYDSSEPPRNPLPWNDEYTLVPRDPAAASSNHPR
jgi:hypothetical protein